jgi:hypothetical protein
MVIAVLGEFLEAVSRPLYGLLPRKALRAPGLRVAPPLPGKGCIADWYETQDFPSSRVVLGRFTVR